MQVLDLNLLPVVYALLVEENVTKAAARVNLSVPATSRSLERARKMFGDPLLVRHGRGVVMTPRARLLLPELASVLNHIDALTATAAPFDPARLKRTFTIRANEAVISAAGACLAEIINEEAPGVEVRYQVESSDDVAALRSGSVDLAVGSYSDLTSDLVTEDLITEHVVGVLRAGHQSAPANQKVMALRRWAGLNHIDVSRHGRRRNPLDAHLTEHGLKRRVIAVVPSFATALAMVATSDATALAPARLASIHVRAGGLVAFRPPVPLPTVTITSVWHGNNTADAAHQWLRSAVRRAAQHVAPAAGQ
jgi:DNA-binding transcriptional LysR family regulator